MVDNQEETTNEPGLVTKQSAPRLLLLLLLLLLPAFASCSCSFPADTEPCLSPPLWSWNGWCVSLEAFVSLMWLFFQKPLNCPVDHHHRKSVFLVQYIPPHRKTDLSFYSLLIASSLIEEYWSIGLDYAPVIALVVLLRTTYIARSIPSPYTFRSPLPRSIIQLPPSRQNGLHASLSTV